jgi:flavorubredoxin
MIMKARKIKDRVSLVGAVDWERRLFDGLIALPDGTSYNAYLIQGSEKTALIDTVDPSAKDILLEQLADIPKLDYLVAHHAEQDHSGSIPVILAKYPNATLICSTKAKDMLTDLMPSISPDRIQTVNDKDTLSLGDKTLEFIYTPWVHWPETMCTYLREDRILFSCDFFGAHLATADIFVTEREKTAAAAKTYFAEIMMPFRPAVRNNISKLRSYQIDIIAPSHGPLHNDPAFIISAHEDWISEQCKNLCLIPYVSMHGSTKQMVDHLVNALFARGVRVQPFDLTVTNLGTLAMELVDAATVVFGTPTVLVGPHPAVLYAAVLANALRPKTKFASIIGSYGWASQAKEQIIAMIPNLKVELLEPIICKGAPKEVDFKALDNLADAIASRHKALGLI